MFEHTDRRRSGSKDHPQKKKGQELSGGDSPGGGHARAGYGPPQARVSERGL